MARHHNDNTSRDALWDVDLAAVGRTVIPQQFPQHRIHEGDLKVVLLVAVTEVATASLSKLRVQAYRGDLSKRGHETAAFLHGQQTTRVTKHDWPRRRTRLECVRRRSKYLAAALTAFQSLLLRRRQDVRGREICEHGSA